MDDNGENPQDKEENLSEESFLATESKTLKRVVLEAQGKLPEGIENEEMLKALLLSGELSISDLLDSEDISELSAEKVADEFKKKSSQ